ncbi:hypothetical protein GBAR_LOCUS3348, partial [Geodia barretti]
GRQQCPTVPEAVPACEHGTVSYRASSCCSSQRPCKCCRLLRPEAAEKTRTDWAGDRARERSILRAWLSLRGTSVKVRGRLLR